MQKKPKSINALMGYMRDVKGINIKGSNDKKKLRYMGYFCIFRSNGKLIPLETG